MCLIDNLMKLNRRIKHETLTEKKEYNFSYLKGWIYISALFFVFSAILKTHLINGGLKNGHNR